MTTVGKTREGTNTLEQKPWINRLHVPNRNPSAREPDLDQDNRSSAIRHSVAPDNDLLWSKLGFTIGLVLPIQLQSQFEVLSLIGRGKFQTFLLPLDGTFEVL